MKRKLFTAILVGMVFMLLCAGAALAESSGTCGAEGNETGVTWTLDDDGVLTITGEGEMAPEAFKGNTQIKKAIVTGNITTVSASAFEDCTNLEIIELKENVLYAHDYFMNNCSGLKALYFTKNFESFTWNALSNENYDYWVFFDGTYDDLYTKSYVISFCNMIVMHDTVWGTNDAIQMDIEDGTITFSGSGVLTSNESYDEFPEFFNYNFTLYDEIKIVIEEGITGIDDCHFAGNDKIVSVQLPEGLTEIGEGAFRDCKNLASINFPSTLEKIDAFAFFNCSSLSEIELNEGLKSIGKKAFSGASTTDILRIPKSVETFGRWAFYGRTITNLYIPKGANIPANAISCEKLYYDGFETDLINETSGFAQSLKYDQTYQWFWSIDIEFKDVTGWYQPDENGPRYYIEEKYSQHAALYSEDGYVKDYVKNETRRIDNVWYNFGEDGALTGGWQYVSVGFKYDPVEGWISPCYWYYFNEEGIKANGWLDLDGETYWLDTESGRASGEKVLERDGKENTYYFDEEDGTMASAEWVTIGEKNCYFKKNGTRANGWTTIEGKRYYFNDDGTVKTGLIDAGGNTYFTDEDGAMVTDKWIEIEGENCYFTKKGPRAKGWTKIEGKWYYFNDDGTAKKNVWLTDGGKRYYLDPEGVMASGGFKTVDGKEYCFKAGGTLAKGWTRVEGKWYYFNDDGTAKKNVWLTDAGKRYYLDKEGVMASSGIKTVDGKKYFFKANGSMVKGWVKDKGSWYYFNDDGSMATGWIKVGGKEYYLDENGVMVTNTKVGGRKINKYGVAK